MKENRKLLKEVLKEIRHDMTDEEVLNLLAVKAFDPFPFILLNLVLSCVAAIQAPLIMMSQNRQGEIYHRPACGRCHCQFCWQSGIYLCFYRGSDLMDGYQYPACSQSL